MTESYPVARRSDHVDVYHGVSIADPYRWLEEPDAPEAQAWISAQNEVTGKYLHALPQRQKLLEKLSQRWDYPRYSAPFKEGGRYFFFKNDGLQPQSVLYVQDALHAAPRVLLDPNLLSDDGTVALSSLSVSDDGRLLGYGLSNAGSDWVELKIREVESGRDLDDEIKWVKFSGLSWTKDHRGFFYSRFPTPDENSALQAANRHHQIWYHVVGTAQNADTLIYQRPDEPDWLMNARVTQDGRLAMISIHQSGPQNRLYYLDLGDPQQPNLGAPLVKLIDSFQAEYDVIENDGEILYVQTDRNAPRGQVVAIDLARPESENWQTIIAQNDDTLNSVALVGEQFIANYRHNASSQVVFTDKSGVRIKELSLPELATVSGPSGKRHETELFYVLSSYLQPTTIFRYDVSSGESTVFRASEVDFDASPYQTSQVWFESRDGTRVPMFVTHRRDLERNGDNPTLLYGYGGFNVSLTPGFSVSNTVWLEAGGVLAIPNLRGGGEFGKEWHDAGTKERKQNVFDDFIAAAKWLIRENYTSPQKLAIAGGSNGGLLVGAVANQRPELFAVALPAVGVMDMLRFHQFTIGSAWVYDYGSSDDESGFQILKAYSPLHNIRQGAQYPATLVMTADHDDRVVPAHSFKYAATLQAAQAGAAPILIRIETKAGHGAGKPTAKIIEAEADKWAFVMANLQMKV